MGKGRSEGHSHLWEHRLHLNHWGCLYVQSDTCLVLDWIRKMWVKWSNKNCTRMCACVFFQDLFLLPKVLNFGSRGGSVWTCAVHPLKSYYGRGKDIYKINCQAFPMLLSLRPHHLLWFFFQFQTDNEVPLSLPAKEAQISELHSGLSTGGLAPWRIWAHRSTSTCPLVNVAKHAPEHQDHSGGCVNSSCSWTSEMNWACWCGWMYALLSFSSSVKHQGIHFSY